MRPVLESKLTRHGDLGTSYEVAKRVSEWVGEIEEARMSRLQG